MHNLTLPISALARIDLIDNVIESYKNTILFFKLSKERNPIELYNGNQTP